MFWLTKKSLVMEWGLTEDMFMDRLNEKLVDMGLDEYQFWILSTAKYQNIVWYQRELKVAQVIV